ncbi:MAG: hypothetical protein ABSE47_06290 [Acidimicrobiales bacterium]
MTPALHSCGSRLRRVFGQRLEALRARTDEGQALVLALIVVLMIGILPAVILTTLQQEMPYVSESVNYEAALAAAESGVQEYANLLDQYPGYQVYAPQPGGATKINDPTPAPGLPGGNNAALGAWAQVTGTSPPEWFTYYPDTSELTSAQSTANPLGGSLLLVVTGKAGKGKTVQYRRIEAALTLTGVIQDVYFSNFEQPGSEDLDQWVNTYPAGCTAQGGGCQPTSGANEYDEVTATTPAGYTASNGATKQPMATALCQYDANQPNTFIDWYSANIQSIYPMPGYPYNDTATPYGPSNQYYGPWYGSFPDPLNPSYQFGAAPLALSYKPGSLGSHQGDQSACNTNYWISGDDFNGPVYSQDELTTCQNPQFNGSPFSLATAVPGTFVFPTEKGGVGWPGAGPSKASVNSATGYGSTPWGYNWDPWQDCGGGSGTPAGAPNAPTLNVAPSFGVAQSLPQANQALTNEIETGVVQGCVFTGPTMIRFSYNVSTTLETMYVWSPLTKNTYGIGSPSPANGTTTNCGYTAPNGGLCPGDSACTNATAQVNASNVVQTGDFAQIPVTANGLALAVQSLPTAAGDPNDWSTLPTPTAATAGYPASPGCIDPWVNNDSAAPITVSGTCVEGDAILSGAVSYRVTVSAANDVVIARSLVDGCAVNANGTYQNTLASCGSSLDVLGLIALNNIWMARPYNPSTGKMAPACADDVDMPTSALPTIGWGDMVPNCTVVNPVIDAATAALTGFFEVQYWREGDASGGTIHFNGSDAVNNAGQFGVFNSGGGLTQGYLLILNYDTRLKATPPPDYLPATDSIWKVSAWVTCGGTTPNPDSSASYPSATVPACTPLPGAVAP